MMGSYIKIDRKILDWEWWSDINTQRLFLYMLLKANWKDGSFKGVDVPRGSFVSSISKLSESTNLTVDEIRTALKHLKSTNEITSKSHSKFTVFTVNNYNLYQDNPEHITEQIPSKSHSIPTLFPTIEEKKEYIIDDDGVIYVYMQAKDIAQNLISKYWGREPTEADIENVRILIIKVNAKERTTCIDKDKKQLLEYAFEHSVESNALNWNYVKGIMMQLDIRGITNIDEAYEYDSQRKGQL